LIGETVATPLVSPRRPSGFPAPILPAAGPEPHHHHRRDQAGPRSRVSLAIGAGFLFISPPQFHILRVFRSMIFVPFRLFCSILFLTMCFILSHQIKIKLRVCANALLRPSSELCLHSHRALFHPESGPAPPPKGPARDIAHGAAQRHAVDPPSARLRTLQARRRGAALTVAVSPPPPVPLVGRWG